MTLTQITTNGIKDGEILNADINASAAIAGSKITPDFGSQNITTTGQLQATSSIPAYFKNAITGTTPAYVLIGNNTQTYAFAASSSGFSINDYTAVNIARLSIDSSGNSKVHGDLIIQSNFPRIYLTDNDTNPDYSISNANGKFAIYDETNTADRFTIQTGGADIYVPLTINSGLFVGGTSVSGAEGGQIELTQAPNSTLAGSSVIIDNVNDSIRIFENASPYKGLAIDLSTCAAGVASQILTSSTDATYTGNLTFGSGSTLNLSTNDIYLNARVINNQAGGTDDGLYIGYGNAGGNSALVRLYGGGQNTNHLNLNQDNFYPYPDNVIGLGTSAQRFTNLFLSGGVNFGDASGGTSYAAGNAHNTLDDYEEGTYTPAVTAQFGGTATLHNGISTLNYVKIGKTVTISGRINITGFSGTHGGLQISLPFNTSSGNGGQADYAHIMLNTHGMNLNDNTVQVFGEAGSNVNTMMVMQMMDSSVHNNGNWLSFNTNQLNNNSNEYIGFVGSYKSA